MNQTHQNESLWTQPSHVTLQPHATNRDYMECSAASDLLLCSGRLTLCCSGPGRHKVHSRGRSAVRHNRPRRARVLSGRRPAAELGS
jgi:hypothetical protein